MKLLKLFIYTIFATMPLYLKAINPTAEASKMEASKIKDIDKIISCNDCCYPVDEDFCFIFYNACKTETYQKGVFMMSKADLSNSKVIDRIKKYKKKNKNKNKKYINKEVIILVKNMTYFFQNDYIAIGSELEYNINKMKNASISSNRGAYENVNTVIDNKFMDNEPVNRDAPKIYLFKNTNENIINIFKSYNSLIEDMDIPIEDGIPVVRIHNKNNQQNCINKAPTTQISTADNHVTTSNLLADFYNNPTSYQTSNKEGAINWPVIISISVAVAVPIAVIIVGAIIYKKCSGSNSASAADKPKMKLGSVEEHIYEEPYDIPAKIKTSFININKENNINPNTQNLAKSVDNVYIECLADDCSEDKETIHNHVYNILETENNSCEEVIGNSTAIDKDEDKDEDEDEDEEDIKVENAQSDHE